MLVRYVEVQFLKQVREAKSKNNFITIITVYKLRSDKLYGFGEGFCVFKQ